MWDVGLFSELRCGLRRCHRRARARRFRRFGAAGIHEKFTTQSGPSNQERVEHFRAVLQGHGRAKQFRTKADRDFNYWPYFRSQRRLYASPLDNRKPKSPTAPAFSQIKLGEIVPHHEISRIQWWQIGASINPSWKAEPPRAENDFLDGANGDHRRLDRCRTLSIISHLGFKWTDSGSAQDNEKKATGKTFR